MKEVYIVLLKNYSKSTMDIKGVFESRDEADYFNKRLSCGEVVTFQTLDKWMEILRKNKLFDVQISKDLKIVEVKNFECGRSFKDAVFRREVFKNIYGNLATTVLAKNRKEAEKIALSRVKKYGNVKQEIKEEEEQNLGCSCCSCED